MLNMQNGCAMTTKKESSSSQKRQRKAKMETEASLSVARIVARPSKVSDGTLQGNEKPFVDKAKELDKAEKKGRTS